MKLVAHDWGGPAAFIMMLRHPDEGDRVLRAEYRRRPGSKRDLAALRNLWRFWYQIPMSLPVIGPRVISDPNVALFAGCSGRGSAADSRCPRRTSALYVECMRQPGHAEAGSRWYRSFQTREMLSWMRGEFDDARVDVPVRWLSGTEDPVITPDCCADMPTA